MYAESLKCLQCGREFDLSEIAYQCTMCGSPLEVKYNLKLIAERMSPSDLNNRKIYNMWRYSEFLPVDPDQAVTLGEGFTPLVKAEGISKLMGVKNLYLKLDFISPTGSFKDRGSSLLVSKAIDVSSTTIAIDSSGNAAASIAAYSAKAGLHCYVFTPSYASIGKLIQAGMYGAEVIKVDGTRRDVFEVTTKACKELGWYYCGFQTNPFASEGMKTIAFEICEQMRWNPPERIVFPVGTGSGIIGCWMALRLLKELGWIERLPSLVCVQPNGCAPIVRAHQQGSEEIEVVDKPRTVAEGLMIGHPVKGKTVLRALNETNGLAASVSDVEIVEAAKWLAKSEGSFVEPSAAASIAGLRRLIEEGEISPEERIVCILTGTGLKTVDAYSSLVRGLPQISPSMEDVRRTLR